MTESDPPPAGLEQHEQELARRLGAQRPVPTAGFRGALARHLSARDPGYGPRPERLRATVSAYLGSGILLVVLGALQATGHL